MPTLREILDGPKEVFDVTLAVHNERISPKTRPQRRETVRVDASIETERQQRVDVNRYMAEISALGQRVQHEYQRGYQDGYKDGVYAGSNMARPKQQEQPLAPKARAIQSNRDVDLEE